ncbi:MAG: NfeD family protein [Euryarchaeota archaeon]|jgi:membrane protein implicated in regulation of membrane protease activity|nr:NfeD family protein [Euryarchaeota archaeon]MBT5594904.1 NfeD family protein [Euryarchaeota archaeon]MBT5844556.1 NfeD family protein [Euryarchaeota archaeon]MBT6640887.1 NfeD family protein [Euryarchaeota archaeon]MBT6845196.1 NfeD family protein [Euryarchaeota archaeon]
MSLISNILDLVGLGGITGIDILFAVMALIGTFLFLIYFVLILIGGVADGALEFAGFETDFDMGAEGIFHMLTIQGILSFIMMFGIAGLAVTQSDGSDLLAIFVAIVSGLFSMYIIGKVFQVMKSLEVDSTVKHSLAVGAQGKVYMDIRAGETGQVQVEFQNAMRTCDAVLEDESMSLKTGKFVEVVKAIGETLVVKPLSVSSVMAEEE